MEFTKKFQVIKQKGLVFILFAVLIVVLGV